MTWKWWVRSTYRQPWDTGDKLCLRLAKTVWGRPRQAGVILPALYHHGHSRVSSASNKLLAATDRFPPGLGAPSGTYEWRYNVNKLVVHEFQAHLSVDFCFLGALYWRPSGHLNHHSVCAWSELKYPNSFNIILTIFGLFIYCSTIWNPHHISHKNIPSVKC